jgi:hypothetical protein
MVEGLDRLRATRLAAPRELAQIELGLGVDGNPQRVGAGVGSLILPLDVGEDVVRLAHFLQRLGLLHGPQFEAQPIENFPDRVGVRQLVVGPALLLDQRLPDRRGGQAGVEKRRLKLRILLALRFRQRLNIGLQFGPFHFRLLVATRREVIATHDARPQLIQSQFDRVPSPTKDPFSTPRAPCEIIPRNLCLKGPSLRTGQFMRGILDRGHHRFRQLPVHRLLLETSIAQLLKT